jgi:predicted peroxiredoxin
MPAAVRGLTIVLGEPLPERFRTALTLAAANAALGGRTRLFCQSEAVALLRPPIVGPADEAHAAAGLPVLAALFEEALGLGVEVIACQSGLALTGIGAGALDRRIGFGGPVSLLQTLGEDRLVMA